MSHPSEQRGGLKACAENILTCAVGKVCTLEPQNLLCPLLAEEPWASYRTSLLLSPLVYNMGMIRRNESKSHCVERVIHQEYERYSTGDSPPSLLHLWQTPLTDHGTLPRRAQPQLQTPARGGARGSHLRHTELTCVPVTFHKVGGLKQAFYFITLHEFAGQEFRQGSAGRSFGSTWHY